MVELAVAEWTIVTWRTDAAIPVGFGTIQEVPVWRFPGLRAARCVESLPAVGGGNVGYGGIPDPWEYLQLQTADDPVAMIGLPHSATTSKPFACFATFANFLALRCSPAATSRLRAHLPTFSGVL